MRRIATLLLTAIILIAAAGCGTARCHLTVNRDGSGDVDLRVALDAYTLDLLSKVNADPLSTLSTALMEEGYTVSTAPEGDTVSIIARKHVDGLAPRSLGFSPIPEAMAAKLNSPEGIQVDRGFFKTCYYYHGAIDPLDFAGSRDLGALETYFLGRMEYEFLLTLPILPRRHNAHGTEDAGRTLVWQLDPGRDNRITVEVTRWNAAGFALTCIGLVLLGAGVWWYLRRNPGEKSPDE